MSELRERGCMPEMNVSSQGGALPALYGDSIPDEHSKVMRHSRTYSMIRRPGRQDCEPSGPASFMCSD